MFHFASILPTALSLLLVTLEVITGGLVSDVPGPEREIHSLQKPMAEEGRYFEGDIIVPSHKRQQGDRSDLHRKSLVADRSKLWPDRTLYYRLSDEFTESDKYWIRTAIADLQAVTCVRFVETYDRTDYMYVRNTNGCAAPVGYQGTVTEMYLMSPSCHSWGTIQHEFLHALGFWHEHTRPDRDQYVNIVWNRIIPGREENFLARSPEEVQYQGLPYDYRSVMHYRAAAFSRDGYPTIETRDRSAVIGQRVRYSRGDLAKLNRLYSCGPAYYTGYDFTPVRDTPAGTKING